MPALAVTCKGFARDEALLPIECDHFELSRVDERLQPLDTAPPAPTETDDSGLQHGYGGNQSLGSLLDGVRELIRLELEFLSSFCQGLR